jgi:hypothetical protein
MIARKYRYGVRDSNNSMKRAAFSMECQGIQHSWPERHNNLLVYALFREHKSLNIEQDALSSLSWCYFHVSDIAAERPASRLIFLPVHINTFAEDDGGFSLSSPTQP